MNDNELNQIVFPSDYETDKNVTPQKIKEGIGLNGNEPMTDAQREYLKTLAELHHEKYEGVLTRAQAEELIHAKQQNISIQPPYDNSVHFWKSN